MSEIKPALDPFEWKNRLTGNSDTGDVLVMPDGELSVILEDGVVVRILNRHGAAALALYGQPLGFTREDATNIRAAILSAHGNARIDFEGLASLADRIEALLPPGRNSDA